MLRGMSAFLDAFKSKRVGLLLPIGFASGLPYLLSGGTLMAWMQLEGVPIETIGLFAAVALPYNLKLLWAPILDRFQLPFLGRRRGWVVLSQLLVVVALVAMGLVNPAASPSTMAVLAVCLASFSASQDIVADAYRTDVLPDKELGTGTATFVTGYRIALIVAGAGALILSEQLTWRGVYWVMAALMLIGVIATVVAPEAVYEKRPPRTLREALVKPWLEFFRRPGALWALGAVMLYKFGDAVASHLIAPFLLSLEFTAGQVGAINKGFGLAATILGALVGGGMVAKLGVRGALLLFGLMQAGANVGYMLLAAVGKNVPLLWAAIGIDQFFGGLGTAAFVAFLMALCNKRFSAFQYALLSSASSLVGRVIGTGSGFLVVELGWGGFFLMTIVAAVPALLLILAMPRAALENRA
jgi:MFS transporter, PAT family, beta-lactamase induction signal transducer AmpG